MPRRKQEEAVGERVQQRRGRGTAAGAEAPVQPTARKRPVRKQPPRKERKPRVHADLLTVAYRGPLAGQFRKMAERCQLSLAGLLQDALLAYEANVAAGYHPGTALAEWKGQQTPEAAQV